MLVVVMSDNGVAVTVVKSDGAADCGVGMTLLAGVATAMLGVFIFLLLGGVSGAAFMVRSASDSSSRSAMVMSCATETSGATLLRVLALLAGAGGCDGAIDDCLLERLVRLGLWGASGSKSSSSSSVRLVVLAT